MLRRKKSIVCSISGHSLGAVPLEKRGILLREQRQSGPIAEQLSSSKIFDGFDEIKRYTITGNGFPLHYILCLKYYV
jgi:hypothetical protein